MELIKDSVKVAWVRLGEGMSGNYDPNDPKDVELLRFDVSVLVGGEWTDPGSASYCTWFPAKSTVEEQGIALAHILGEVYEQASQGHSIKKLCEKLSWIQQVEPSWINKESL
jgi:hypothetical protein